jgi:hypothetical protein
MEISLGRGNTYLFVSSCYKEDLRYAYSKSRREGTGSTLNISMFSLYYEDHLQLNIGTGAFVYDRVVSVFCICTV